MAKNQKNDGVGDKISPAVRLTADCMRCATDQARQIQADTAQKPLSLTKAGTFGIGAQNQSKSEPAVGSCVQTLWFSYFFDGTGNNMDADEGTLKHSSVARLYRVHKKDNRVAGQYRIYIPGVGTYFDKVGDKGGTTLGYGSADKGDDRLDWALKEFDEKMKAHIARANNPSNAIIEINLALFGFSRGAALARAFVSNFVLKRCAQDTDGGWRLKSGGYKIRVRFMGLFDTVASVGFAMGANNTSLVGTAFKSVSYIIGKRLEGTDYAETRPTRLAFAKKGSEPGADPAPGEYNGHMGWGDNMLIPEMVEEVRHFVAAHEIRNSFPLDSVSALQKNRIVKPAHFFETVYPGVHSDVGGSYRPGEGARSDRSDQKLGLIPLGDMYKMALEKGVPLLPKSAWDKLNADDFDVGIDVLKSYSYYQSKVHATSTLGDLFNAHMALYYAWRFRHIHNKQKGDHSEDDHIKTNDVTFKNEEIALNKEITTLETANNAALKSLAIAQDRRRVCLQNSYGSPETKEKLASLDQQVVQTQRMQDDTQDKLLRAKAKLDALPKTGNLKSMLDLYDAQLLKDAEAIYDIYTRPPLGRTLPDPTLRASLRPHYLAMMTAYENEYDPAKRGLSGLKDENIIAFFDNYVHDSLAGFARDATLPSDPRVIYLGGNEKYKYAELDTHPDDGMERAVA